MEDIEPLQHAECTWEWTDGDEAMLEKMRKSCVGYAYMHKFAARACKRKHTFLKLPAILLSAAASTSLLSSGASTNQMVTYVAGGCTLVVTMLEAVDQWLQLQEQAAKHFSAAAVASHLLTTIANELALPRVRRTSANKCVEKCAKEYDALLEQSNELPKSAVRAFQKHVECHGVIAEEEIPVVQGEQSGTESRFQISVV